MTKFLSFWFTVVYKRDISINAQANLSSFWIRDSFTSMDSKSGNERTDEHEGGICGENPNDEKH